MPDEETRRTERATERLTIFSDAVVAIAMTLLAIDLPVPEGNTVSAFWTSFRHNDGHYAAFLISFAVIAGAWTDHHDLFRYVTGTDARTRTYNMGWLLTIVLVPFATRMLIVSGQSLGTHALRFGFYALLQLLEAAALYAMLRHMVSRGLIEASAADDKADRPDVGEHDDRLRAVDPGLLRHHLRLGALDHHSAAGRAAAPPAASGQCTWNCPRHLELLEADLGAQHAVQDGVPPVPGAELSMPQDALAAEPARSSARCSAMFATSVSASIRSVSVVANRYSARTRWAAEPYPRPRWAGSSEIPMFLAAPTATGPC